MEDEWTVENYPCINGHKLEQSFERGGQGFWGETKYEAKEDEYLVVVRCTRCGLVRYVWIERIEE